MKSFVNILFTSAGLGAGCSDGRGCGGRGLEHDLLEGDASEIIEINLDQSGLIRPGRQAGPPS